jgi:hypothetical protein
MRPTTSYLPFGSSNGFVGNLRVVGDVLYFSGKENLHGQELWALRKESSSLSGDYDRNSVVDGADFLLWQRQFGNTAPRPLDADGNQSGAVDAADLAFLKDNFGARAGSAAAAMAPAVTAPLSSSSSREASTAAVDAAFASSLIASEQESFEDFVRRFRSPRRSPRRT